MIDSHRLYDSAAWADPDAIHALFARMRREDPVHLCQREGYPDLWHLTKHADIFEVEHQSEAFLNEPRLIVMPLAREKGIRAMTGGSVNLIRSLVTMDPPEHPKMRLLTQAWFMPKNLAQLQGRIDASAAAGLERLRAADGVCDFARDVAMEFPLRVIMTVLGVPETDFPMMLRLTQELFGPDDPDLRRQDVAVEVDPSVALQRTFAEFSRYFNALTEARRAAPKDDVASLIANAEIDGKPIDNAVALGYYIILATAGHDTTSYSLTEAVRQLAASPDLYARLRRDPDALAPKIAEEAIRYASPVRHFVRTAQRDYTLRGRAIREGQSVVLWYPSGSRDEEVFAEPDVFNPDRDMSTRHAAFGHAAHMCLGMHLARQEVSSFLKLMARDVESLEISGSVRHTQASFVSGIKSLPMSAKVVTMG